MVDELRRAGHDVHYLNPVAVLGRTGSSADYSQVLLDEIAAPTSGADRYDLLFATATDDTIVPDAIDEARRRGLVAVNLSTDDYSHPFRVARVASRFDLNWSTVRENLAIIQGYGARVITMPWGANPHVFKPGSGPADRVIGFIGTTYGARARNIAYLQQAGLPVRVHGRSPDEYYQTDGKGSNPIARAIANFPESWQRFRHGIRFPAGRQCMLSLLWRSIQELPGHLPEQRLDNSRIEYMPGPPFEGMSAALSRMALSLGSIELCSTYVFRQPLLFIRLREFEVAMSGGVHLVNRFPELEEYFEPDREMLFYGSAEELVDKAGFYLRPEQDAERRRIGERARLRSEAEHTWLARFRRIGKMLDLTF